MSEQRTDPGASAENKTIAFHPDRRLAFVRFFHTLSLFGMLACLVFGIWRYRDELTPERLRRVYQYLRVADDTDGFSSYTFETGLRTVYAPFRSGLAVYSGDTYYYISGSGGALFSRQLKYKNPVLTAGDRFVLIYDLGNYGLYVANNYAEYLDLTFDQPILSARLNDDGALAVVTNGSGYRSTVSIYSERQKLLCRWNTAQYYVRTASVSPDGQHFAALALEQDGLQARSRVLLFTIGQEQADASVDLGDTRVYGMAYDETGALVILCEDAVAYYDDTGRLSGRLPLAQRPEEFFMQEGCQPLIAWDSSDGGGQQTVVVAPGSGGTLLWQQTLSGTLRGLFRSGDRAAVLMNDRLLCVDLAENPVEPRTLPSDGARGVLLGKENSAILIYSDYAEKIEMEEN